MNADYTLSARAILTREVDILVLGGGMSGVFAALGARRGNRSVVIVEPSNVLGGQGTSGGVAGFVGDTGNVNDAFQELVTRLTICGKIDPYRPNGDRRAYDLETCAFVLQELVSEAGAEVWLHAAALDVKCSGGIVREVLIRCGPSLVRVHPRMVIDATGNALVANTAGIETVHLGPRKQLPMSLYFTLWETNRPVDPFLPPGCPRWENSEDLPMTSLHAFADGRVEVKMKVVGFDAADGFSLSRAEIHARRQMMGLVYHLQTRGYQGRHSFNGGKPLSTHTLASVSRVIGQREGRRIVGRMKLADEDVKTACTFDDAVAVGTYHLDFHWTDTEKRAGTGVTDMVEPYHIPLSAMRPVGLDNVLCPGRSLSGDQLALSSYRAMATCAQMGMGAGIAAAQAVEHGLALDDLDPGELKSRLLGAGQSLDLSDYGDYLRCLRKIDQPVPLASRKRANGTSQLGLCRLAYGKTLAVRYERESGRTSTAIRSRTQWQPSERLEAARDGELTFCTLTDDNRLNIHLAFADGSATHYSSPAPLRMPEETTALEPMDRLLSRRDLPRLHGVPSSQLYFHMVLAPEGFPAAVEPKHGAFEANPGNSKLFGKIVAKCFHGTMAAFLVSFAGASQSGQTMLLAFLAEKGTGRVHRYLVVDRNLDPLTRPAIMQTAIGIALIYDRAGGETRYFEGSLERFAPVGTPPPEEADLQAMPYADHVILSA